MLILVQNWFQNRRAKSKQDAKKAGTSQPSQPVSGTAPSLALDTDELTAHFMSSNDFMSHNDSAVSVNPMSLSNGLGITRADSGVTSNNNMPTTLSPQDLLSPTSQKSLKYEDLDTNRKTLTQDDFDTFAHGGDYDPSESSDHLKAENPSSTDDNNDLLSEYFPELTDFTFDNALDDDVLGPTDMQPAFSTDSYGTTTSTFSEAPSMSTLNSTAEPIAQRQASTQSSTSDWSEHSTPSLSLTPAAQQTDSVFNSDENDVSPRGKVPTHNSAWQPGQSVPVDYQEMDREFREAAMRSANQSNSTSEPQSRTSSNPFSDSSMGFPEDQIMSSAEAPAGLTQSMNNMEITNTVSKPRTLRNQTSMSSMSGAGSIAARRQRPRPQPLSSTSLRSASYCAGLPTSTGVPASQSGLTPAVPTLRRIKSSNVMNGIANGRISKNIGGQRSPLNFTFADAMNSPKFARSVSSYSPAGAMTMGNASLAPPTPLSPTDMPGARFDFQRQLQQYQQAQAMSQAMSRQPSMNESIDENGLLTAANTFSSPPTTPLYGPQFSRGRLGMLNENTPPQSAPATQQCFSGGMFPQSVPMQASLSQQQQQMLQAQQQSYMPMMPSEYPPMPNVMMQSQPQYAGQYLEQLAATQQYAGMPQMVPASQPMGMGYPNMQYARMMNAQQMSAQQYNYLRANPGMLLSQQQAQLAQAKNIPAADFFVHEYSPPQDVKNAGTPRKADGGPKNYTFANHGPEHFEKVKNKDLLGSPNGSLSGASSSG